MPFISMYINHKILLFQSLIPVDENVFLLVWNCRSEKSAQILMELIEANSGTHEVLSLVHCYAFACLATKIARISISHVFLVLFSFAQRSQLPPLLFFLVNYFGWWFGYKNIASKSTLSIRSVYNKNNGIFAVFHRNSLVLIYADIYGK